MFNDSYLLPWNKDLGEDIENTKKMILLILKEQKVSSAKIRYIFQEILNDIDKNNPVTL